MFELGVVPLMEVEDQIKGWLDRAKNDQVQSFRLLGFDLKQFKGLHQQTAGIGLISVAAQIERILEEGVHGVPFSRWRSLLESLMERFRDEIKQRVCLILTPQEAVHFQHAPTLEFEKALPDAVFDYIESHKAFAVCCYTASAFHSMRVMEYALRAFATKLDITIDLERKEWGTILRNVNGAIQDLPYKSPAEKDTRDGYSEIYNLLNSVKDAWRNPLMHVRSGSYSPNEAQIVWLTVGLFVEKLVKIL